jgi:hypothetical protein
MKSSVLIIAMLLITGCSSFSTPGSEDRAPREYELKNTQLETQLERTFQRTQNLERFEMVRIQMR